ncbi:MULTISPECIES: glutamine synthetase [unclassified Pseudomonas]|uniref:glutamine synthetase n=1 Tax=unclassified Pseudomonas TaxID=196821 RepID=UPI0021CAA626|nr:MULTISPECIES: glutamine synthetase [unclassified Pseudomonas]MCU1735590.1 glutamine synthetase [Pseudomonas sp. 20P_3.2_Bac4]MCU1747157.1 glutamine synthetase [Pseudomonas sp. 20P_3.2_Bac5]
MTSRKNLLWITLLCIASSTQAMPRSEPATCNRSANLLACADRQGGYYSVQTQGATTYLRGYDALSERRWAQTNSRYGQLTFFTGIASDGEAWVGYSRRVGWTTLNRVSSSSGQRFNLRCNRLSGCQ